MTDAAHGHGGILGLRRSPSVLHGVRYWYFVTTRGDRHTMLVLEEIQCRGTWEASCGSLEEHDFPPSAVFVGIGTYCHHIIFRCASNRESFMGLLDRVDVAPHVLG